MARRTSSARQEKFPVEGMKGPDPELTDLADKTLDAMDEASQASEKVGKLKGELLKMLDTKKKPDVTHRGVTFTVKELRQIVTKGRNNRSEEE